ncbi:hypothetical protein ASG21_01330 [Chryseobacterium sp. Leaf394]|nr:hypothetical protein ASG21_01330 [Chryseobacterium sp. Leaf394]
MKKNVSFYFSLLLISILFFSCRTENIIDQTEEVHKQNLIVKRISFEELYKEIPSFAEKVKNLNSTSANNQTLSKIYTDAENGFF